MFLAAIAFSGPVLCATETIVNTEEEQQEELVKTVEEVTEEQS